MILTPTHENVLRTMLHVEEVISEHAGGTDTATGLDAINRAQALRDAIGVDQFDSQVPVAFDRVQLCVETIPDDCIAIWPWMKAPAGLRELFRKEFRFLLYLPISIPQDARVVFRAEFMLGAASNGTITQELGDGSRVVGFNAS